MTEIFESHLPRRFAPFWAVLVPGILAGQSPPRVVDHSVSSPPVRDGRLNDPAWRDAEPISGFIQRERYEGQPVTERTVVRIISDGQALYVGAWLFARDPGGIIAGEKVRDGDISKSDY